MIRNRSPRQLPKHPEYNTKPRFQRLALKGSNDLGTCSQLNQNTKYEYRNAKQIKNSNVKMLKTQKQMPKAC